MTSYSNNDLNVYKQQVVMVFNPSGTFIDVWRDAPLLDGFKEAINSAVTPLKVKLPRRFDSFDEAGTPSALGTIAQGNIVKYYLFGPGLPNTGKLRYQGVIDAYAPEITENGEEFVTVTLTPPSAVIADHVLVGDLAFGTNGVPASYVDPVTMFNWFFTNNDSDTGEPYSFPLIQDLSNPASSGNAWSYTFSNQDLLSIWQTILLMLPSNWFFRLNVDNTVTLNVPPGSAQHQIVLGQHIAAPQYQKDWVSLKNVGAVHMSGGTNVVRKGTDLATFGKRVLAIADDRIVDTTTAGAVAQGILNKYDQMTFRSKIRLIDYRGDANTSIGYDIESIKVGDTIQIINPKGQSNFSLWDVSEWDVATWDFNPGAQLNQVTQVVGLDYHFDFIDIEIGSLQPNQDRALAQVYQQLQDFTLV